MAKKYKVMKAENWLNDNVKDDDWNKLEEGLNDSLWTNNVVKYMEAFLKEGVKEMVERAYMAGQFDAGKYPIYKNAQDYYEKSNNGEK
jgi:hypothetical protein